MRNFFSRFNKKKFISLFVVLFGATLLINVIDVGDFKLESFLSLGILCLIVSGLLALIR